MSAHQADFDTLVIGAGVVGLACARALALSGRSVLVVEAEARFGEHASSRNSEVIHAGVYYPPGSNKARLCLRGKTLLYAYCAERHVPHRQLGKLIVATTSAEVAQLEAIRARALASGVELELRSQRQVAEMEPEILCSEALWSASSGIIDSHAYMQALIGDMEHAGGTLVLRTPFLRAEPIERPGLSPRSGSPAGDAIWRVWLAGEDPGELSVHEIVNCAGLQAPRVAANIEGLAASGLPVQRYCRGHYFGMRGRNPFRHLVYPVPVQHGLGIHVTLDSRPARRSARTFVHRYPSQNLWAKRPRSRFQDRWPEPAWRSRRGELDGNRIPGADVKSRDRRGRDRSAGWLSVRGCP